MTLLDHIKPTLESFKTIVSRMGLTEPTTELRVEMKQLIANGLVHQDGNKKGAKYQLVAGAILPTVRPSNQLVEDDWGVAPSETLIVKELELVRASVSAPAHPLATPTAPQIAVIVEATGAPLSVAARSPFTPSFNLSNPIQVQSIKTPEIAIKIEEEPELAQEIVAEVNEPAFTWVDIKEYQFVKYVPDMNEIHREILENLVEMVKEPGTVTQVAEQLIKGILKKHGKRAEPPWRNKLSIANALSDLAQMGKIRVKRLVDPGKYSPPHVFGPWLKE